LSKVAPIAAGLLTRVLKGWVSHFSEVSVMPMKGFYAGIVTLLVQT